MHRDEMKRAVAACAEAGIGLTAMKTQGEGSLKTGTRSEGDMAERLRRCAQETRSDYCIGCTRICEAALDGRAPVGDIMRHLRCWRSYGDRHRAQAFFDRLPPKQRIEIAALDYDVVENLCPQQMAIGRFVRQALKEFCA